MISKKNIIFAIIYSLFYLTTCQLNIRNKLDIKKLQSFVKCVKDKIEKSNIDDIPLDLISSLLITPQNADYKKIQELLTKNFDKIKDCIIRGNIPIMPDGTRMINLNNVFKDKYDWKKFIECLINKVNNIDISPFKKLIEYINEGKYLKALREEFKLRNNGNFILKECTPAKMQSLLNKN